MENLDLKKLLEGGISREQIKISSHSHHIVSYPPVSILPVISHEKIFSSLDGNDNNELAVYVHIPFCTGKCIYCQYKTYANIPYDKVNKYLCAVKKELGLLMDFAQIKSRKISSLYFGGGTPTYLTTRQMNDFIKYFINKLNITSNAEITCEASPETITGSEGKEKLKTLHNNGVNRLSFGVQSFDNEILKLCGRRHNRKTAISAFKNAKEIGFENINIDLIPGLPDQTLKGWERELKILAELKPPSVTMYPLTIKKHAIIYNMFKREPNRFPNNGMILLMNIMAVELLKELGYKQKPAWWYITSPKYIYRQQIHKWKKMGEQIALGVSSYSYFNNYQYRNYNDLKDYINIIQSNRLPIERGQRLSKIEQMRRFMIFGIKAGINKKEFKNKFGVDLEEVFYKTLNRLERLELINNNRNSVNLTYKGYLFADEVSKDFFSQRIKKKL